MAKKQYGDSLIAFRNRVLALALWQKLCLLLGIVILAQLLVPSGTVPLLARLDGRPLAFSRIQDVQKRYARDAKEVEFRFGDQQTTRKPEDLGWEVDAQKTLARMPEVRMRHKLVPFGVTFVLLQPVSARSSVDKDPKRQLAAANRLINQYSSAPANARGSFDSMGKLRIISDRPGERYDLTKLDKSLSAAGLYGNSVVKLSPQRYDAAVKTADFDAVKKQADQLARQNLYVTVESKKISVFPKVFLPHLELSGTSKKDISMHFSKAGTAALLAEWGKHAVIAPGTTRVHYLDGVEVSRKTGASGRAIDGQKAAQALKNWLKKPSDRAVQLSVASVAPLVKETREYTETSKGLQAKLNYWVKQNGGGYQIAVRELGGKNRQASVDATKTTVLASTYKLFVAYSAYRLAEQNKLSLEQQVAGKSIENCITRAIVYSDNDCAKAVASKIGWSKCESLARGAGFLSIRLNNYDKQGVLDGEKTGSAADLAEFLSKLSEGKLLNAEHTASLIGYMKRQVYRQGIPAGASGSVVADKVGFLDGATHDAAVVYGAKSTYVLVIMSNRSSDWRALSDASKEIATAFD